MINFIKYDKNVSLINVLMVFALIIFKMPYIWFLVIELFLISLYLIFMMYRFYLRSRVLNKEMDTIKKIMETKFEYSDYLDVYEDEDSFILEIGDYKKLINVVLINFIRMDKKLNLESYKYLDLGLDNLKDTVNGNKKRKYNYELVKKTIDIIKKYYDKNCIRKDSIKNYIKLLRILIVFTIISIVFLGIYIYERNAYFYSVISSIFIAIMFVVNWIIGNENK